MAIAGVQLPSISAERPGTNALPTTVAVPLNVHPSDQSLTMALATQTGFMSGSVYPMPLSLEPTNCLLRIRLSEILPEDGAASMEYTKTVDDLWDSLARYGAAIIELNAEDSALVRCALESAKLYFRTRTPSSSSPVPSPRPISKFTGYIGSSLKEMYYYRAGRNTLAEAEHPPPCMSDVYRCLGKASRVALGAICRHLQLRSDVFCSLLDDCPLPRNDVSSSVLLATHFRHSSTPSASSLPGTDECLQEFERGMITLVASDSPGLQVCDSNGLWYLADIGFRAGDLLLLTGRALQHITAGLCKAGAYRVMPLSLSNVPGSSKRVSLMFRLMPRSNAILDGSVMAEADHVVSESFGPVRASKFFESLNTQDSAEGTTEKSEKKRLFSSDSTTLRNLLCDPMTGDLLEDAFTAVGCGHTFGSGTLKRVRETGTCSSCGAAVKVESMVPNLALQAVALAFDREEKRRRVQVASRKRRKELREQREKKKRLKENKVPRKSHDNSEQDKGLRSFNVNEKVLIKGNKRTPEKLVGKEAFIASKCLNGWYLVKLADNGESVRLQYRSLQGTGESDTGVGDLIQKQSPHQVES